MQALYGGNINLPSPPTSPRMSGFAANQSNTGWQPQHLKPRHVSFSPGSDTLPPGSVDSTDAANLSVLQPPPLLRSYRSSPFLFETAAQPSAHTNGHISESSVIDTSNSNQAAETLASRDQNDITDVKSVVSAPASPISGRSHVSPKAENFEDAVNEFQELDFDMEDDDDVEPSTANSKMTAAEIRAQKRKMKRFRYVSHVATYLSIFCLPIF